mmetsp:Transcript_8576/g.11862  ORF Transcript_8576/g.11862 Transcript_8576/m.11862 type:complete len:226 (-) Transcript_8576:57-734(-)
MKTAHIIDCLSKHVNAQRVEKMNAVLQQRTRRISVVLENLYEPNNIAASLRTIEGFGIQDVHIINKYGARTGNPDISLGAEQWITLHWHKDTEACINYLKQKGHSIWSSDLQAKSSPLHLFEIPKPIAPPHDKIAMVFGNETRGISKLMKLKSDRFFYLPMSGFVQSFNVSVSVAISLAFMKAKGVMEPNLTDEEKEELKLTWLLLSVGNPNKLLKRFNLEVEDV